MRDLNPFRLTLTLTFFFYKTLGVTQLHNEENPGKAHEYENQCDTASVTTLDSFQGFNPIDVKESSDSEQMTSTPLPLTIARTANAIKSSLDLLDIISDRSPPAAALPNVHPSFSLDDKEDFVSIEFLDFKITT